MEKPAQVSGATAIESNTNYVLLNCLDWQHEGLTRAISVIPDMTPYPHLRERQQQITWHIQTALREIEELCKAVQADSSPSPE